MLWYGYIYYFAFFLALFVALIALLRLSFLSVHTKRTVINYFTTFIISFYVTFAVVVVITLYYLLDNYSTLQFTFTPNLGDSSFRSFNAQTFLVDQTSLSLHLISLYAFPFIYIFVLITVLSILFCLSYNLNELNTFFAYCTAILAAGYTMFFTSSLLVFFFFLWNAINTFIFYPL